jgi:hypothetical protein
MELQVQEETVIGAVAELRWAKTGDGTAGFVDSGGGFQEERGQGSSGVATCLETLKEEPSKVVEPGPVAIFPEVAM